MSNDSIKKTFLVAFLLCVVCSVLVSSTAVSLREKQQYNKALDKKKNIITAAGLFDNGGDIDKIYDESIVSKLVDLDTGEYSKESAKDFRPRKAVNDPAQSIAIKDDIAGIGRRSKLQPVYLVKKGDNVDRLILPVRGKGLWSTLYGFLAVSPDLNTIKALSFYEHAETPGLGGEIDNPKWKALWDGKKAFNADGEVQIEVIKGKVNPESPLASSQVDGISGATITARGVGNMLSYWLSEQGYGKYINKLKKRGLNLG